MSKTLVEINQVHKSYKRGRETVSVFADLNLNIPQGDFLAVMGPSGSGKTTLLNLVGGLDAPDSGCITVDGRRIDQLSSSKLAQWRGHSVGFISQSYNLLPALNAAENIALPLLLTNLNRAKRKKNVQIALQLVGLEDRAKHKPSELSGGQQQRVAIARALVADPALLICDEPTGDLDRETANNIMSLLQELNARQGKTIVMVTHDTISSEFAKRTLNFGKGVQITETAAA